uniref:Transposase n=1 Tax=Candidatus Kentrum sp. LFY TaxID=2126342 RepID=A0A450U4Z6_9GAMM|nr:MAG: Transposase [Candidatus Kentron sp. LFY]
MVFDHFHIIELYNEKLANLRREMAREADVLEKKILTGTRWLLMKTSFNLVVEKDEHSNESMALRPLWYWPRRNGPWMNLGSKGASTSP